MIVFVIFHWNQKWLVLMYIVRLGYLFIPLEFLYFTPMILKSIVDTSMHLLTIGNLRIEEGLGFSKMGWAFSLIACIIFCEHPNCWLTFFTKQNAQKYPWNVWMFAKIDSGNVWKRWAHFWKSQTLLYQQPIGKWYTSTTDF